VRFVILEKSNILVWGVCIVVSSAVKNELCRVETDRSSSLFELAAAARISGLIKVVNANEINLRLVTENAAFARRIFSQIKDLYGINAEISIRRSPKLKKILSISLC